MAMTKHREPNMVKWVGVRPGHNGEEIVRWNYKTNGETVLYTVGVGKILLLFDWNLDTNSSVADAVGSLEVYDDGDARRYALGYHKYGAAGHMTMANSTPVPHELVEGDYIKVYSSAVTVDARGYIHGILIDA